MLLLNFEFLKWTYRLTFFLPVFLNTLVVPNYVFQNFHYAHKRASTLMHRIKLMSSKLGSVVRVEEDVIGETVQIIFMGESESQIKLIRRYINNRFDSTCNAMPISVF